MQACLKIPFRGGDKKPCWHDHVSTGTHLRDAVGQLLVVHGHALGLVQRHQRTRQEHLQQQSTPREANREKCCLG